MIGQMIRLMLNAGGIPTIDRTTLGATPVVRKALLAGEIDIYVEYTGNAGFFFNVAARPGVEGSRSKGYELGARLDYDDQPHRVADAGACQQRLGARGARRCRRGEPPADHERLCAAGWQAAARWCSPARPSSPTRARCARWRRPTVSRCARISCIVLAGGETSATIGAAAARTNGTNTAMVYGTDGGIVAANLADPGR